MAGQYQYLFTPIRIGQTVIPNRIVFSAHSTNLAEENLPGSRLTAYYVERARGGCGLIITEEQSVHPSDWAYQPLIHGFSLPPIPGADLPHVATAWQVLQKEKLAQAGEYVLVFDQLGFHQATSVAELLAERGCLVELVTPQFYIGDDLSVTLDIELWYRRALARGMRLTANYFLASLEPNGATIINNYTGQPRQIENLALAVMATPQTAYNALYHQLQGKVKQLHRVGDCVAPRRVEHAILDGERAARAL